MLDNNYWGIIIEFLKDGTFFYLDSDDNSIRDSGKWKIVENDRIFFEFNNGWVMISGTRERKNTI